MKHASWTFQEIPPGLVKRDPFEAEFFTGEEESEDTYGRTDALVREAIQNSLDAFDPSQGDHVRVRFSISSDDARLSSPQASPYLKGLLPHLDALRNDFIGTTRPVPPMRFLTYEDYNTFGLCGDPARCQDPPASHSEREDYYWFWWNIGRSGKSGADRGRWGLGKTVFPSTSRINALFGLSVRRTDGKCFLLGQTITKTHRLDGKEYPPEGFFCAPNDGFGLPLPITDESLLSAFKSHFRITRETEPGLSIVVPYCFETLRASELLASVIVHYFAPILRGQLVVDVGGPDLPETRVDRSTIHAIADQLEWKGHKAEKKHAHPPFDLAEWAISTEAGSSFDVVLDLAGRTGIPEWKEDLFPPGSLDRIREKFARHDRIALRVPLTLEYKSGTRLESHFDVFLEHDDALPRGEDYFVREGMTIAGISTLGPNRGLRGIVFINEKPLSTLLGDCEGPAHNDWSTGETRPDRVFSKWKRRVTFVKLSMQKLVSLLALPPEKLSMDLLEDIFNVEDSRVRGSTRRVSPRPVGGTPPTTPPVIDEPKRWYRITQIAGGFSVAPIPDALFPEKPIIRLALAYDIPDGSPLRFFSPFDFDLTKKKGTSIQILARGSDVHVTGPNRLTLVPVSTDFSLHVSGFDQVRDLYVSSTDDEATA